MFWWQIYVFISANFLIFSPKFLFFILSKEGIFFHSPFHLMENMSGQLEPVKSSDSLILRRVA